MSSYGMIIDLDKCFRCRTCYVACKKEHKILAHPRDETHPYEYYRLRYIEWENGRYPVVRRGFIPVHCMQCEEPICVNFCSVDAISKRVDGVVRIDKERCNGCGVCASVCPYGALYIGPSGKADGCDFCLDRIDIGSLPRCVEECPAKAILFGRLDDPESRIYQLVGSDRAKPLLSGGVKNTRVYYIPSLNEPDWKNLHANEGFLRSLEKRKKDLPPVKGVL